MEIFHMKSRRSPLSGIALLATVSLFSACALWADDSQPAAVAGKLTIADLFRLGSVSDPQISPKGGKIERLVTGDSVVADFAFGQNSAVVALISRPQLPAEVFSFNHAKDLYERYLAWFGKHL
jgi:hypothetical protein